jgi:hypothetical protein
MPPTQRLLRIVLQSILEERGFTSAGIWYFVSLGEAALVL